MAERASSGGALYVISVAAELAGVHPQTLRVYERKGLVRPKRTSGNTRRYSQDDIELLRKIQHLTNEGVNLAGVVEILKLERELERMRQRYDEVVGDLMRTEEALRELAGSQPAMALVPVKDVRRVRRAMKSDALDSAARRRIFTAPPASDR